MDNNQPTQPNMPPQNNNPYPPNNGSVPPNQPAMNQPYPPQPMMKPPKQPMDPKKKKGLILGLSISGAVLVLGIVAAVVVPILLKVDYSSAYNTAKELKPNIYNIYRGYDCGYVVDYINTLYQIKSYNEFVENCKAVYDVNTDELISKLENTDGVRRNNEIGSQFEKFKTEYDNLISGGIDSLKEKLNLWQAMHSFVVTADKIKNTSSDAECTTAANYLIESGNETLKSYGEGWLEKTLAATAAYRAYRNARGDWREKSNTYDNLKSERHDWIAENKPDMNMVAPLNFGDTSKVNTEFTRLYDLIKSTYEKNYNFGSGDCDEFLGEVTCN